MKEAIDPVSADLRLTQLLGQDEIFAEVPVGTVAPAQPTVTPAANEASPLSGNAFEDMLSQAVESLNNVSRSEVQANQMMDNYLKGSADLQEVMVAQAKMSVMVQMAVTTVNAAVNTFKEITQMQV